MATAQQIEDYLIRTDLPFENIGEGLWVIHDEYDHIGNIVVNYIDPIVMLRVKIMEVPEGGNKALFRTLLEFNATELVHGAFALEGNNIVVLDTLQAENLDFNEFQASLDALTLALAQLYPRLARFHKKATE